MSTNTTGITDTDRRNLHQAVDTLFAIQGLTGICFTLAAFTEHGSVDVIIGNKGNQCPDDVICMNLRALLDQCTAFGTRNALSMRAAIRCAIAYIEHLHAHSECGLATDDAAYEGVLQ